MHESELEHGQEYMYEGEVVLYMYKTVNDYLFTNKKTKENVLIPYPSLYRVQEIE